LQQTVAKKFLGYHQEENLLRLQAHCTATCVWMDDTCVGKVVNGDQQSGLPGSAPSQRVYCRKRTRLHASSFGQTKVQHFTCLRRCLGYLWNPVGGVSDGDQLLRRWCTIETCNLSSAQIAPKRKGELMRAPCSFTLCPGSTLLSVLLLSLFEKFTTTSLHCFFTGAIGRVLLMRGLALFDLRSEGRIASSDNWRRKK
jgi:hypothetical protein